QSLDRIKDFLFRLKSASLAAGSDPKLAETLGAAQAKFEAGLDDDLNTSLALGAVFELLRECNTALDGGRLREDNRKAIVDWFSKVDERLAIIPAVEHLVQHDEEIDALVAARNQARKNRDFAESDRIRQQLLDRGITIEDTREGTKWRR